jgi:hypothetical protein
MTPLNLKKAFLLITDHVIVSEYQGKIVPQNLLLDVSLKGPPVNGVAVGAEFPIEKLEVFWRFADEEDFFVHGLKSPHDFADEEIDRIRM